MFTANFVLKLKCAVLVGITMLTFWGYLLYRPGGFPGACVCFALVLFAGLMSFDKRIAIHGNGTDMPGILFWLSFGSILLSVVIFQVIPHELSVTGLSTQAHEFTSRGIIESFVFGVILALWLWAPLGSYSLIDRIMSKRAV